MFLKVATTMTLIAACFGHEPAYDERASNEAISTQSFNRDDIPVSYKHMAIHVYSTQKPSGEDDVIRPKKYKNSGYRAIQFAPLVENTTKKWTDLTKKDSYSINVDKQANNDFKENRLEPRKQPIGIGDITKSNYFIPGHNIDVNQSPNRNLGHNAIYPTSPGLKGMRGEISYNFDNVKYEDPSPENEVTKSKTNFRYLKHEPMAWMLEEKQKPEKFMYSKGERNIPQNIFMLDPPTTQHTHRMQINIARANGHAHVIARAIVIGDILKNSGKPQRHTNLKGVLRLNGEQRTLLYPKRQQLYQFRSI